MLAGTRRAVLCRFEHCHELEELMRVLLPCAASAAVSLLASLPASAETGDLWEVTVHTTMAGMPAGMKGAMPPQTSRQCSSRNREQNSFAQQRQGCKVTEQVKTSDGFQWKFTCTDGSSGSGRVAFTGADRWDGETQMTVRGQQMATKASGKRVGSCELAAKK
jgi:hypothetical protein